MIVIADDITGAAEIAGIAWRKGFTVQMRLLGQKVTPLSGNEDLISIQLQSLNLSTRQLVNSSTEITVIATDTRSMSEEEAVKTIETICQSLNLLTNNDYELHKLNNGLLNEGEKFHTSTLSIRQHKINSYNSRNSWFNSSTEILFKKTDSVLRGHVKAELNALMKATGKTSTLLIPQNPSKGRIIKDGIYYINGTPLHETSFRYDPEFPAKTAKIDMLLGQKVATLSGYKDLKTSKPKNLKTSIILPDATSIEEIKEHVSKSDLTSLFAGGADMFEAVLDLFKVASRPGYKLQGHEDLKTSKPHNLITPKPHNLITSKPHNLIASKPHNLITSPTLILCGSTQSRSLINEKFFANKKAIEVTMPVEVFHGAHVCPEHAKATAKWIHSLKNHWQNHEVLIVRIGHETTGGKEYAVRLRHLFGELAFQILPLSSPDQGVQECRSAGVQTRAVEQKRKIPSNASNLSTRQLVNSSTDESNSSTDESNLSTLIIIEGGATAYSVLTRLGISTFIIENEYSPGVVCLSHGSLRVILKPGSYPWGNLFELI